MPRIFAGALVGLCLVVTGIVPLSVKAHARELTSWDLLTAFEHCTENGLGGHDFEV